MCVHQYEVSDEKHLDEQRNTIKVAVLECDPLIKDLVAISYYDTKPVYFLSSVIEDVRWIVKSREIYSKKLEKKVKKMKYVLILLILTIMILTQLTKLTN